MRTFLINLDRNVDRLKIVTEHLHSLGIEFERQPGVDGQAMTPSERNRHVSRVHNFVARMKPLSPGEIGCGLSHVAIYEKMVSQNIPVALIFEDDIELDEDAPRYIAEAEARMDTSRPQVYHFTKPSFKDLDRSPRARAFKRVYSETDAEAYMITLPAAKALLRVNYPLVVPFDVWRRWCKRNLIELYKLSPGFSRQRRNEFVSDIVTKPVVYLKGLKWLCWKVVRCPCVAIDWLWWKLLGR